MNVVEKAANFVKLCDSFGVAILNLAGAPGFDENCEANGGRVTELAAALAEKALVPRENIQRVIPTLSPRWGRLERVANPSVAAETYVDFAHTPDGLDKVLSAAKKFTRNNLWVVFGAGGDRDRTKRPLMGGVCASRADKIVVTSDNPRSEDPEAIIAEIISGIPKGIEFVKEADRLKAIHYALSNADEGDVIIIAGKGHETYQEIHGVKHHLDEREEVARCLQKRG